MKKIALITGATSGIGKAIAFLLANNNFDLIITGRRKDLLETTGNEISTHSDAKVLCLSFDVRNKLAVDTAIQNLSNEWKNIDVLINNAGLSAGLNPINEADVDDWERMIDTNIKGLLYMTKAVSPIMVNRGTGHIINISSIAGREVYENGNVYCATKHAVEALNKGMRLDLVKSNIKVTSIQPGMVETEFSIVRFHGDTERAAKVYSGFQPLLAEDVAEAILFAVTRPSHVNINEILITPTAQASISVVNRK